MLAVLLLIGAALAVRYARPVFDFLSNEQQLQAWLDRLGPLGPLAVIALNAMQVVVAFVPGYAMMIAAGYLYGFPMGAIYGVIGMALGGLIAISLARRFGRPFVVRMVGASRLEHWEGVARLNSLPVWFLLMLGPFGDVPYYIAGLTSLAIWKIIAIALLLRTPSALVAAAIGAGLVDWRSPWVIGGAGALMLLAAIVLRNQRRIEHWMDNTVLPWVTRLAERRAAARHPADPCAEAVEYDAAIH
ncbi:MAG TPA: VTT domain-containing protein [Anaerolineae bacterium]|nr:VTT domain-containing protein [Anaerolineae bacterium]